MHKKKISICSAHLPELYEAVERGDLKTVEKIEHELTPEEECVACTYVLKSSGNVVDALEHFLKSEGFEVNASKPTTVIDDILFWTLRLTLFSVIFLLMFEIGTLLKQLLNQYKLFQSSIGSPIEIIILFIVSVMVFLKVDDLLFD